MQLHIAVFGKSLSSGQLYHSREFHPSKELSEPNTGVSLSSYLSSPYQKQFDTHNINICRSLLLGSSWRICYCGLCFRNNRNKVLNECVFSFQCTMMRQSLTPSLYKGKLLALDRELLNIFF